ncbi:MAG: hypothetical protein ABIH34_04105 [Nanoarchaeota archaeon]
MQKHKQLFKRLQEEAKDDPAVIGFFLGGSRGKGRATRYSGYDVYIIVKDTKLASYKRKYPRLRYEGFDLLLSSHSQFKKHAAWMGDMHWARYNFTHLKVAVDKKDIQQLVNDKAKIPKQHQKAFVAGNLDGYINYIYRSLKCFRDKNIVGARLEAALSIQYFFDVIFGMHGRTRPYYKYLKWELTDFPLTKFPLKPATIISSTLKILETADVRTQQKLLGLVEKALRKEGYGKVFDSWGPNFSWMMRFKP